MEATRITPSQIMDAFPRQILCAPSLQKKGSFMRLNILGFDHVSIRVWNFFQHKYLSSTAKPTTGVHGKKIWDFGVIWQNICHLENLRGLILLIGYFCRLNEVMSDGRFGDFLPPRMLTIFIDVQLWPLNFSLPPNPSTSLCIGTNCTYIIYQV